MKSLYINVEKIFCFMLICIIIFSFCNIARAIETMASSYDLEEVDNINIDEINREVIETSSDVEKLKLDSRIALIFDRASGRILYEKNGNKQTPMASTTKIMTAIVVLENANLKDVVTIDSKAAGIGGSRLGLSKNDKITVNDLLYGLLLRS